MLSVGPAARTMAANPIGTDGSRSPSAATHSGCGHRLTGRPGGEAGCGLVESGAAGASAGLQLDSVHLAPDVHPVHSALRRLTHRHDDDVAPGVVDRGPLRMPQVGVHVIRLGALPGHDAAQGSALGTGRVPLDEVGHDGIAPHPVALLAAGIDRAAQPGRPEASDLLELLGRAYRAPANRRAWRRPASWHRDGSSRPRPGSDRASGCSGRARWCPPPDPTPC